VTIRSPLAAHDRRTALQLPSGGYAMLALDQRESLRGMFPTTSEGGFVDDDALRRFKAAGVQALSPFASAVLLDRPFALQQGRPAGLAETCALIAAADQLVQQPGQDITRVGFDEQVTPELLADVGAVAVKVLVLWHRDSGEAERTDLVSRAMELAAVAGAATLVEGIVRPAPGAQWSSPEERHRGILDCARELAAFHPDIYKAEVPGYVQGDLSRVAAQSALMSDIVRGDWVILSNGVQREAFPDALTEALKGGADGFLAGRAVWADTVTEPDPAAAMRGRSVGRLERLTEIVRGRRQR
jgi:sulfofructosephosphate aldolase